MVYFRKLGQCPIIWEKDILSVTCYKLKILYPHEKCTLLIKLKQAISGIQTLIESGIGYVIHINKNRFMYKVEPVLT